MIGLFILLMDMEVKIKLDQSLRNHKPDLLWFMTDPRFWTWLWAMDNEIRTHIPMVYHHVWDNFPAPMFNKGYYQSNDKIVCISKVTHEIVKTVAPDVDSIYFHTL